MLGDNIRNIRKSKDFGLNELARIIGIAPAYLSLIERNKRKNVGTEILTKIANALDVSVNAFFQEQPLDPKKIELDNKDKEEITTIAAHHDGDEWTEEELEDIEKFKDFVRMKRQQRKGK